MFKAFQQDLIDFDSSLTRSLVSIFEKQRNPRYCILYIAFCLDDVMTH